MEKCFHLSKRSVFTLCLCVSSVIAFLVLFDPRMEVVKPRLVYNLGYQELISADQQLLEAESSIESDENAYFSKVEPDEIVYVLVVCEVSKQEVNSSKSQKVGASKSFRRQLIQLDVLLKTAAIFARRQIHFIIVTNTLNAFLKVKEIPSKWPDYLQNNLKLSRRSVWHPKDGENLLKVFRPCTVECIFLHETLPDVDAAIYIDTDTFFLRSPEDMWPYLRSFNESQMAGISPCYYWYGTKAFGHPFGYYGKTGINCGVIVMNMTRMRALPFNLSETLVDIYHKHAAAMYLMDQDILNHFYSLYPQLLYPIKCTWNMRFGVCRQKPFPCESAKQGISLIHGPDISFFASDKDESVKRMFQALASLDVNKDDVKSIPRLLKDAIHSAENYTVNLCGRVKGFTDMAIKYPKLILSQKEFPQKWSLI